MKTPDFKCLREQNRDDGLCHSYARQMHPDPRLFKYRWWIFWRESPCDGMEFLAIEHSLCTSDAMVLLDKLSQENECHWVYNQPIPRDEPGVTPFARSSTKWMSSEFASSLDNDADPQWQGFR